MWAVLLTSEVIENATVVTKYAKLRDYTTVHAFEYKVEGLGTVVITAYTSITGQNWVSNGIKANGVGVTSGPGGDGMDVVPMRLKPGEFIRFTVTATGATVVTLWLTQK